MNGLLGGIRCPGSGMRPSISHLIRKRRSDPGSRTMDPVTNLLSERRVEAVAAARFVGALRTDQDACVARDEPLRMVCRGAAYHANRERLGDVLGNGQQLRHR